MCGDYPWSTEILRARHPLLKSRVRRCTEWHLGEALCTIVPYHVRWISLSRTHLIGSELDSSHLHAHLLILLLHVRHLHLFSLLSLFSVPLGLLPQSVRALFATDLNIYLIEFSALIDLIEPLFVIVSYSFLFLR